MARLVALTLSLTFFASSEKEARATGAVVPHSAAKPTAELDVRVAVAGGTRWSQITVQSTRVMWLVPARPGAALDWASEGWLDALDEATNVRVLRPAGSPPCPMPGGPQPARTWAQKGTPRMPSEGSIHATEADVRAHAAARGYTINASAAAAITATYAAGYKLVSFEIDGSSGMTSSPTLRVSDDGAPLLPLALTGSDAVATKVSAFAIATGAVTLPNARDVDASQVLWNVNGSTYEAHRAGVFAAANSPFLRESSSHAVLFNGTVVDGSVTVPSIAATYFGKASASSQASCEGAAKAASTRTGIVRRVCAPGALARVPGGASCQAGSGEIDPAAFTCGAGIDDLALALSEKAPSGVFVTRFAGQITKGSLGRDMAFATNAASRSSIVQSTGYGTCDSTSSTTPPSPPISEPPGTPPAPSGGGGGYVESDSCGGSSSTGTVVYYEDTPDESSGCGGNSSTSSSSSSGDSDGWDSSDDSDDDDSSSDDSEGWDSSDDDSSDDSDGWDSSDDDSDATSSSSSSSDGCGGSSSSSSSSSSGDDGWDGMKPRSLQLSPEGKTSEAKKHVKKHSKKKHAKKKKHGANTPKPRPKSPVSRFAFLAFAILLPLRRLLRKELPKL